MEDPGVFQGNFLFVNKNATNVKSRSPDEAFTIGSHVCGKYARWRKVARVKPKRSIQFPRSGLSKAQLNLCDVYGEKTGVNQVAVEELHSATNHETVPCATRWRSGGARFSSISSSVKRQSSKARAFQPPTEKQRLRKAQQDTSVDTLPTRIQTLSA